MADLIFKLSRRLEAHGEDIDTLKLREPTAGDLAACGGDPFTISNFMEAVQTPGTQPTVLFNNPQMITLLSRLAAVPRGTIERMSQGDYYRLRWDVVGNFFLSLGEAAETATPLVASSSIPDDGSPPASTSRGSGSATREPSLRSVGRS